MSSLKRPVFSFNTVSVAPAVFVLISGDTPEEVTRSELCSSGNFVPADAMQHVAGPAPAFAPFVAAAGAPIASPDPAPTTFHVSKLKGSREAVIVRVLVAADPPLPRMITPPPPPLPAPGLLEKTMVVPPPHAESVVRAKMTDT